MLQPEEAEEAEFDDIKAITVRRHKLEKWVNEPFFEQVRQWVPICMMSSLTRLVNSLSCLHILR